MNTRLKNLSFAIIATLCLGTAMRSNAVQYTLDGSTATAFPGNTTSTFYSYDEQTDTDSGAVSALYSSTIGGNASTGYWIVIDFGGNPSPTLSSAFIKSGNDYLWWDATDLATFNAGNYDSLKLVQDVLKNPPRNAFLEISHAGLNNGIAVPDAGSTAALLGFAFIGLSYFRRRFQS